MNLRGILLSEISQSQDKYFTVPLYEVSKIVTLTERERRIKVARD